MRLRRSGTRNTLDNFSSIELKPLLPVTSCQLPVVSSRLSVVSGGELRGQLRPFGYRQLPTDYFDLAAGFFDLLLGRLGKLVGMYSDRLGQLALTEHLHQCVLGSDDANLAQQLGRDLALAQARQPFQVHYFVLDPENVGEAALRQAAVQRHLAALEAAHHARTAT